MRGFNFTEPCGTKFIAYIYFLSSVREMSEDVLSTTLAYKKSPKTSKRTSFQDELQAAISARARKNSIKENYSYADDFEDDDALEVLLNQRKKKIEMFKSGKKKAIDVKPPDTCANEDRTTVKPKRVSFMKTRRKGSPTPGGPSDAGSLRRDEMENGVNSSGSYSPHSSSRSDRSQTKSVQFSQWSRSQSVSPTLSEEQRQEVLTSTEEHWSGATRERQETVTDRERQETVTDGERQETLTSNEGRLTMTGRYEQEEAPNVEDQERLTGREMQPPVPQPRERRKTPSSASPFEEDRPKPRPRQRGPREGRDPEEESVAGGRLQLSRPPTSSVSIPLSSADRASSASSAGQMESFREPSPQRPEEDRCISSTFSRLSSPAGGQLSDTLSRSTPASDETDFPKKGKQEEYGSKSFEDYQKGEEKRLDSDGSGQSHMMEKSLEPSSQTQSTKRPKSARAQAVESRYLGALKVLDQVTTQITAQPDMADSIRATVYQEWLKTKQKSTHETLKVKKQEEQSLQEKKKQGEMSRKEDAKASFAAWSEQKTEVFKAKVKEKHKVTQTQQEEIDQLVEKKESAKKAGV
ncbi:hypothetical protein AAFF_G00412950 [Aldrovandia affinis]|uniref:Microtubule-associated protein 9 n=1 Tax=Aldrovandia affinis TaxID=143900 RepID=A0AAD7SAX2_9TELE|nr:hypothetical protein AAFF_G00412950 [Aldrovandia affinis]